MWRRTTANEMRGFAALAADLMRDKGAFMDAMRRALREWPNSCEHNLSDRSINRLAWLGHAGCFVALSSPESCTRSGWWMLSSIEQDAANDAARRVVKEWEDARCLSAQLELMF